MSGLSYHLWTLFLFTKSDFKTGVMTITALAAGSAPLASLGRIPHVAFWVWLHILQHDLANQTRDPKEDEHNKPYRPIPSKRITLENAYILRWVLVPLCFALSACYSVQVLYQSIGLFVFFFGLDELNINSHWIERGVMNAILQYFLGVGSCLIAGSNCYSLDNISYLSILYSVVVILTTIQAQDFKDTVGDKLIGRKTMPIVWPTASRTLIFFLLLIWSSVLSIVWRLETVPALAFHLLGLVIGGRFLMMKKVKADQTSYLLYNVGLLITF
ncbi:uncharacterized protein FOMMEDRAFT_75736 [Fomitiporia mediterranea MF3/22]|uniref:uncharacterized protein n=1 Tax=Fomitiporia mediterranea (strain MF3/22) TaxID=694068 RepID=UPI0004409197|nr:uncharacterized protein FOMMEDRAFT_75736 [Fomitiporia mediterranea MF3/22]EJD06402.1 hypothetical protein FOMMEDRAFT_75736 [Fomitiporia mediterranea MF3/22]